MRYEYLTLQSFFHSRPDYFTILTENGADSLSAQNITAAMSQLGKEGWELVSSSETSGEGLLLFFKRAL